MNMKHALSGGLLALAALLVGCEPSAPPAAPPAESATPAKTEEPAKSTEEAPAAGGAEASSTKSGGSDVAPPAGEK